MSTHTVSSLRLLTVFAATSALVSPLTGCGGDDPPPPAPPPPPAVVFTQADVLTSAKLAVASVTLTNLITPFPIAVIGGLVYGTASGSGGSQSGTLTSCGAGGGTFAVTTVKAAARAGLASGDQVNVVFSSCRFTSGGVTTTLNGAADTTVSREVVFNGSTAPFDVQFQVKFTNFTSALDAGAPSAIGGGGNAQVQDNASGTTVSFNVPSGGGMNTRAGSAVLNYSPGFAFTLAEGVTRSGSLRAEGLIVATTSGLSLPFTLSTPTTLSGPIDGLSVVTPTTGELRIVGVGPVASITAGASSVTVRGDSNSDGTLDLSSVTTWAQLLQ
jgi:hypothetical protein